MQIGIRPVDQSALRFLWMSDNYVLQYQYVRLIFGANCAPFCAIFVLRRCAQDLGSQFPDVLQAVLNIFYMDDFIQSFSTTAAARQLTNVLRTVLQRGGFRLSKFISNNSDALSSIPVEDREKSASETKVLGQTWCLRTDSYTAPPPNSVDNPTTLRQLFSLVSSILDPIGLLSQLVIQFKIILQSLWKLGQTWDQAIPDHIQTSVNKLTDCYRAMPPVSVPRRTFRSATIVELRVFTVSSNSAFAAVIYARQTSFSHTSAQQIFVIGKSRVSPIKQKSIPKLEIEAAVLGVRLLGIVHNAFSCAFPVVKFWTDSCVVLDWIQRQNKLKSFVAHRVNESILHSDTLDWKYVPTKQNPADHGTRGLRPDEISAR